MRKIVIILFTILLYSLPLTVLAQTSPSKIGIDETNVIFPGCRLSKLSAAYPKPVDQSADDSNSEDDSGVGASDGEEDEQELEEAEKEIIDAAKGVDANAIKNTYIKGCIQDIIRFIIIIASLSAILSIAAAGIMMMFNPNAKPIRAKITNTVIGLFLLIVGWNMLPILNASFNNINFLNLPGINLCNQANACTPESVKLQRKYLVCNKRYSEVKVDKDFSENIERQKDLEYCIRDFCLVKKDFIKIKPTNCPDYKKPNDIVAKIQKLIAEGKKERAANISAAQKPGTAAPDASCPEPEKSSKASAAGFIHYKYAEAPKTDLVNVGGQRLHKDAAKGFEEMKAAANKDGVTLTILSGFRSIANQKTIVDNKRKAKQSDVTIYKSSSEPGYSEHHTGMAMDLNSLNPSFSDTKEGKWLADNVSKYGFEISFPEGNKQKVTYEPWHIRYIKSNPKTFCYASKK